MSTLSPTARGSTSQSQNQPKPISALYVATNLATYEPSNLGEPMPQEIEIDGKIVFRRLDAAYYAWLQYRMGVAKKAMESNRMAKAAFEDLRTRFNKIHDWAILHIGKAALKDAIRTLNPQAYPVPQLNKPGIVYSVEPKSTPKRDYLYPKKAEGKWRFAHPVTQVDIEKVDAIKKQALALGWTEEELYQNRGMFKFPQGPGWGLVCFVKGKCIGDVYEDIIKLIGYPPRGSVLCFRKSA